MSTTTVDAPCSRRANGESLPRVLVRSIMMAVWISEPEQFRHSDNSLNGTASTSGWKNPQTRR